MVSGYKHKLGVLACQYGHDIDDLGINLLQCPCMSECIIVHNIFWDIVTTIAFETIAFESGRHI